MSVVLAARGDALMLDYRIVCLSAGVCALAAAAVAFFGLDPEGSAMVVR